MFRKIAIRTLFLEMVVKISYLGDVWLLIDKNGMPKICGLLYNLNYRWSGPAGSDFPFCVNACGYFLLSFLIASC